MSTKTAAIKATATKIASAKSHWSNSTDTSEKALHKVAEKFRLKFATVIPDDQPDAKGRKEALEADGLVGLAADQGKGLGWATFFFHA